MSKSTQSTRVYDDTHELPSEKRWWNRLDRKLSLNEFLRKMSILNDNLSRYDGTNMNLWNPNVEKDHKRAVHLNELDALGIDDEY